MRNGPRIASIFLLPQCEMACRFCASELDFDVMGWEQAVGLLESLRGTSVDNVVLGGGEPLLWPHGVPDLARAASDLGFTVQLCTNGLHLPEGFEGQPLPHRIILPLESMDPARHNRLRVFREDHHALVLRRMETLRDSGKSVTLSTVVTRENLGGLGALAAFLGGEARRGLEVHAWHLYRFLPVGRGGLSHGAELAVDRGAYGEACARMKALDLPFAVYRRDDMLRASTVAYFWSQGGEIRRSPAAG